MTRVLDMLGEIRGLPKTLVMDNELRGFVNEFLGTTAFARIGFMNAAFGKRFLGCLDNKSSYHDKHKVPSRAFSERRERMFVEALVSKLAVEALDEGILRRLSRRNVVQPNAPIRSPAQHHQTREFRAVVHHERLG